MYNNWQIALISAITIGSALIHPSAYANPQIIPDATLPNNSLVKVEGKINRIEGGTTAGGNLFHSFQQFSIPKGQKAFFNNAIDINNIITRVTGNSISNINGYIRANGSANLFLINPNGIIFDRGARLDIGGSFIGSTADSIKFSDGSFFSATSPESPPLLKINLPVGLQFGSNQMGKISNSGQLKVDSGNNITLIGNIIENRRALELNGGQISLAAISSEGLANLAKNGEFLSFESQSNNINNLQSDAGSAIVKSPVIVQKDKAGNTGKIVIQAQDNLEIIRTSIKSSNGGDINLQAKKLSVIDSIIETALNSKANDNGGDISILAESIKITDTRNQRGSTRISSQVLTNAKGNGGDIDITTNSLLIDNKARIYAGTRGKGNAGSVSINASDAIELLEGDIFSQVDNSGIGNSGNINIRSNSLKLDGGEGNRALINTNVKAKGSGIAGTIFIDVKDKIELRNGGRIVSNLEKKGDGSGGNIFINARSLFLERGGRIQALTQGSGRAGNIDVRADESISISGNPEYTSSAGIYTSSEATAGGEGGNINLIANKLKISDNAVLNARSRSSFPGGNITVEVDSLEMTDGGQILTTAFAEGNAGNIEINARENISISGSDSSYFNRQIKLFKQKRNADSLVANDTPSSGLLARNTGISDGGKIVINTEKITVRDGGVLSSESTGKGNSGNIKIDANFIELIDGGQIITNSKDSGNAGNIILNADKTDATQILISGSDPNYLQKFTQASELVEQGVFDEINQIIPNDTSNSALLAKTQGSGNAGSLTLNAQQLQIANQAEIAASTSKKSTGIGGSIVFNVGELNIDNDAQVAVSSNGTGNAGNININARSIGLNNNALLTANTQSAKVDSEIEQATININSKQLIMRRGSNITTNAKGENVIGGNINIETDIIAALENSDISANSENFRGGNVIIRTQGIFGTQFRPQSTLNSDITATGATEDSSGNVEIITPDIDLNLNSIELSEVPVESKIAQACTPRGRQNASTFIATGRGGLPLSPNQPVRKRAVIANWIDLPSQNRIEVVRNSKQEVERKTIVEAQKFVVDKNGDVLLVAESEEGGYRNSEFNCG
ncbi:filamentous hemagglutinin family N-terminal domain protein [Rivularia sp. PCC 7116]|uniref:two-partner secretion domain-containing protein n=1 Tax=Rivularia sp. PCC 7116 TaxID=373994 RepID=UPI00029EF165|nr:filamentous hemagglutinin N-terminal domain-containing protein [Rivularia sp. PCC 7116]AFY55447.1 filamentous hemagglutinin family N-terminal domain protein [Rivularia sp. PCC 7116]